MYDPLTPPDPIESRNCPDCDKPMEWFGIEYICENCGHVDSDEPEPESYND